MKKRIILISVMMIMLLPGCIIPGKEVKTPEVKTVQVWWGDKTEIKTFLDSPEAKSRRWIIESIGE